MRRTKEATLKHMHLFFNWFDEVDISTPYKAIYATFNARGESIMQSKRFVTEEQALEHFNRNRGRYILSHHDYEKKCTKIIAYRFS